MLRLITAPDPVDDPDADIIPALQRGDETALRALMDRHMGSIHSLAVRMLNDPHLAEDITQSVFLRTWQMMPGWVPGQAKLLTWMRRVATHLCLDNLRKKQPVYMDNLPDVVDFSQAQEQHLETYDNRKMIQAALELLPARQKLALTLSYYEQVSQKEGAEIMGMSVRAFESLLARARRSLRSALEPVKKEGMQKGVNI